MKFQAEVTSGNDTFSILFELENEAAAQERLTSALAEIAKRFCRKPERVAARTSKPEPAAPASAVTAPKREEAK